MTRNGTTAPWIILAGILGLVFCMGCSKEMNQIQGDYEGWGEAIRWYDLDENCDPVGQDYHYAWEIGVSAMQVHKTVSGIVLLNENWQMPFIGTNESGQIVAELDYDPGQGSGHKCVFNINAVDLSGDLIADVLTLDSAAGETSCIAYYDGVCTSKLIISAGQLTRVTE